MNDLVNSLFGQAVVTGYTADRLSVAETTANIFVSLGLSLGFLVDWLGGFGLSCIQHEDKPRNGSVYAMYGVDLESRMEHTITLP
jgi:hypothetical protein